MGFLLEMICLENRVKELYLRKNRCYSMKNSPKKHSKYCLNCHYPLPPNAKFCHKCSQKVTDGRVTFSEMLREFFGAVFNFDSRFFQTIGALFVPGKLTTEYFKGRHRRFVHPLRVFLVMTLGLVAAITFTIGEDIDDFSIGNRSLEKRKDEIVRYELLYEMDSVKQVVAERFDNQQVTIGLDTLFNRMMHGEKTLKKDSIELDAIHFSDREPLQIATTDAVNLTVNEVLDKYEVEGYWNRIELGQEIRLLKNSQNFGVFILKNVSWTIFLMMPFLALTLKILYIRRDYLYIEHLIFSFHTHAFVFLIYITIILLSHYEIGEDWIFLTSAFLIMVYLYSAMRQVYQQGWLKTLVKFLFLSAIYFVMFIAAMIGTILVSFALF